MCHIQTVLRVREEWRRFGLHGGRGVQSLFWQCPNRGDMNCIGASLRLLVVVVDEAGVGGFGS